MRVDCFCHGSLCLIPQIDISGVTREAFCFICPTPFRYILPQAFDTLTSMASVAGYRAVIEATNEFKGFMNGKEAYVGVAGRARVLVVRGQEAFKVHCQGMQSQECSRFPHVRLNEAIA